MRQVTIVTESIDQALHPHMHHVDCSTVNYGTQRLAQLRQLLKEKKIASPLYVTLCM